MKKIAILHPQCSTSGGAIKMMLLANKVFFDAGRDTTFFTFSRSEECFSDLQKNVVVIDGFCKKLRLAWRLRSYDLVIGGNPPMQFVAACSKIFGGEAKIVWWHHHIPWYSQAVAGEKRTLSSPTSPFGLRRAGPFVNMIGSRSTVRNAGTSSSVPGSTDSDPKAVREDVLCGTMRGAKRFLEKSFVIPRIDEHWVTSKYVGSVLRDYAGADSIVVNPVLDEAFLRNEQGTVNSEQLDGKELPTSNFQLPTEQKVMITHGRLVSGKGHSTLFSVYDDLLKSFPDLHFHIIGDGELRHHFERRYKDNDLVRFFGQRSTYDIIEEYASADIAVFASTIDAFGMSCIESQALAVPTVVLDSFGARESVVDPDFGYLCADKEGMKERIGKLLGGESQKDKYIQSTHRSVYNKFTLAHFRSFLLNYISN